MTRRNLISLFLLAAFIAAVPMGSGPAAQTAPSSVAPSASGTSEPAKGPDSKDLFESIHVVVGPSARALDPIAVSPFSCIDGSQASCKEIEDLSLIHI